jgi:hypothetical protein
MPRPTKISECSTTPKASASAACSIFELDDLLYALENAAEFLDNEEWPEPETKASQEAANREGAKRIRRMMRRLANKSNDEMTSPHPRKESTNA